MKSVVERLHIAGLVMVAILAGCGGSSGGHNRPAKPKYTEAQVGKALGLHRTDVDWEDDKQECIASVILMTPGEIDTYAGAGDPVATNPAGTVGVKVGHYEGVNPQMCFDRFRAALKRLP